MSNKKHARPAKGQLVLSPKVAEKMRLYEVGMKYNLLIAQYGKDSKRVRDFEAKHSDFGRAKRLANRILKLVLAELERKHGPVTLEDISKS